MNANVIVGGWIHSLCLVAFWLLNYISFPVMLIAGCIVQAGMWASERD